MKNELILLKLGGSLITDKLKPFTLREDVLKRLCTEIRDARQEKNMALIIGHGGGSFPHTSATKYQTQKGYVNKDSKKGLSVVCNDAAKLNRLVVEELISAGENAISVQPSACCITNKGKITDWSLNNIKKTIKDGYIPVPYGDAVLDKSNGCCIVSTEEILGYLSKELGAKRIILAGKVDGVLDSKGNLIDEINHKNFKEVKKHIHGSDAADVTGGMITKVEEMLSLANNGIESIIINGLKPGLVKNALLGKKVRGTVIRK
jgi:isopentenyl phosphate kinase